MRTISQLREAGFTVVHSTQAVDCTEITSDQPFWYYNTNFYSSMDQVASNLEAAKLNADGKYSLIVAGLYRDDEVLVYNLLDAERHELMRAARERYVAATNDAQRARDDYEDALNVLEPYFA